MPASATLAKARDVFTKHGMLKRPRLDFPGIASPDIERLHKNQQITNSKDA
jgi:hypothetical protein